ncbi:MAG: hypothetical protein Q8865_04245, partial [Bacillota bacterium]|nr:hypothetical protein [Bacillota bacterium]
YNNSSSAVDLSGYRVDIWGKSGCDPNDPNTSSSIGARCDFTSGTIQPGATHLVICNPNSATDANALATFNSMYGTSLTLNDVTFVKTSISTTATRMFELETDNNTTVSRVYTNEFTKGAPDNISGQSVHYTYPKDMMPDGTKLYNAKFSPGTVSADQHPAKQ